MENQEQHPEQFELEEYYNELKQQYSLPDFVALSQDFDIEKITDKETSFLARELRRAINEKITAYLQLFETLINPTAPPMFIFKVLKGISAQEKEQIQKFYKTLSKTQIKTMKLDIIYSEKEEVNFINETFKIWQEIKPGIHTLFESFETNFENGKTSKERSYFD
jgi:hypothetical protein